MSVVFVSHASSDREFVEHEIIGLLKALGFETWFAPDAIQTAEMWRESILAGLEGSDWLVLIVSASASASEWVKAEVAWALGNMRGRLIPLQIDNCSPTSIHEGLSSIQCIDFRSDSKRGVQQLVKHLVDAEYAGFKRSLAGRWSSAIQPLYYPGGDAWHRQEVDITHSGRGYTVDTVQALGKLQWRLRAELVGNAFFVGRWFSKRESSQSQGYMTLQVSRNGMYMFGHGYGIAMVESKAHCGVLLLGRGDDDLNRAWSIVCAARREMPSLDSTIEFPAHGAPLAAGRVEDAGAV